MDCTCACWNVIRLLLVAFTNAMTSAMLEHASRAEYTQESLYSARVVSKRLTHQSNVERFSQHVEVRAKKYYLAVTSAH